MTRRELLSALTFTIATASPSQAFYVIASPCAAPRGRYPACLDKYTEKELRKPEQLLKKLRAKSKGLRKMVSVPLDETQIRVELQGCLLALSEYDARVFVDSTDLTRDLGLDRAFLISSLEAVFGIRISHQAARRLTTIGDTINYLMGRRIKARILRGPSAPTSILPCVDACPVDCIHPKEDETKFGETNMVYIDPVECIDCGACVPACPVGAPFSLDDLPATWSHYSKINGDFYR
jgi:ferredoxin